MKAAFLSVAVLVVAPAAGWAEVTPKDVWANMGAATAAFGGELSAEVTEENGTLTAADIQARFDLPMDAGRIEIRFGTLILNGRGDGTVALGGPQEQEVSIDLDLRDEGGMTVHAALRVEDYETIATGDPTDISYHYQIGSYAIEFTGLEFRGEMASGTEGGTLEGALELSDLKGFYRLYQPDAFRMSTRGVIGGGSVDFTYGIDDAEDPVTARSSAKLDRMESSAELVIPKDGVAVTALADALRNGLLLDYQYVLDGQTSDQVTTVGDRTMTRQTDEMGRTEGRFALSSDGLSISGKVDEYSLRMEQPDMLPVPLQLSFGGAEGRIVMPVLKTDDPAEARLLVDLKDVALADELWAMFDPEANLPRDPAQVTVNLTGRLKLLYDMVDYAQLVELDQSGAVPVELYQLALDQIRLALAGAELQAAGTFEFDNADLETFDGFPAPDGAVTVVLKGADRLLDTLVGMGFVDPDEAMGFRMMLGGFARKDEDGGYTSEIAVDGASGRITANGMRLR